MANRGAGAKLEKRCPPWPRYQVALGHAVALRNRDLSLTLAPARPASRHIERSGSAEPPVSFMAHDGPLFAIHVFAMTNTLDEHDADLT
jgi:hypothetical protein